MPAKIRLQRHGKKGKPFFHIVVADGRAPRDGRFIERIGSYNPISNPATIDLNTEKAADWLMKGAQPTDTARAILSYKGVMHRLHLNKGVKKGALTQEQADEKFGKWMGEKEGKVDQKRQKLSSAKTTASQNRLEQETKVREVRAEAIRAKAAEDAKVAEEAAAAAAKAAEPVSEAPEAIAESPTPEAAATEEGSETSPQA